MTSNLCRQVLLIIAFTFIVTNPVYAYLDPGTGSIILQGLIGGIAAGLAVIGIYWQKVKSFFSGKNTSHAATDDEEPGN